MWKNLFLVASLVFSVGAGLGFSTARGQEGLVGYWKFDESSGTTAVDVVGGDNNGTLANAAQWQPNAGRKDGAVLYDSEENTGRVEVPTTGMSVSEGTVMVWANLADPYPTNRNDASYFFGHTTQPSYANRIQLYMNTADTNLDLGLGDSHTRQTDMMVMQPGTWYHVALVWNSGSYVVYVNGQEVGSGAYTGLTALFDIMDIGNDGNPTSGNEEAFAGLLDEARIYSRALSAGEILSAMAAAPFPYASGPTPEDGALYPDTWVTLTWRAGDLAVSHDIYLGDNLDDVNSATSESVLYRGNQTDTFYIAGFPGFAYPEGLVPGATYYWRIDEVNEADPNSPWKGPIWSFSIPPKKAYNPVPADGAESVDRGVTLTWTAGFGAKLHTMYLGEDSDTVANATSGIPLGATSYKPGTLKRAKTYYWRVDEFDGISTYKGDVWSFSTQGAVGSPSPADGAVDITQTPNLTWSPGAYAASHQVYFGSDRQAVKDATTGSPEYKGTKSLGDENYAPDELAWETPYYWRIDEVNDLNADSPWIGKVWSFTTAGFAIVDDFESYTDDDVAGQAIWQHWIDGFGIADNGSQVGYLLPPYAEQTIVHGGLQSMPLLYDNTAGVTNSEATLTLTSQRDWTEEGVTDLSLWFHGLPASVGSFIEAPAGTYTITAAGTDIWGTADEFHYAFKTLTGTGTIEARVLSVQNTNTWAKAGVMIRETLDPGSKFAAVYITPGNGCRFQARTDTGIDATSDTAVATAEQIAITEPYWVKVERDVTGNFRAYYSSDGTTWQTMVWRPSMTMSSSAYIGLVVTSHSAGVVCEGKFSNVRTTGTVGAQWSDQDIGITSNAADPLYVAISNSAGSAAIVAHDDDSNAATIDDWTEWRIPLQAFADQGINLTNVDKIAIGLGSKSGLASPGGSGTVYIDDIRLYRP
jgi:hypothetical protein